MDENHQDKTENKAPAAEDKSSQPLSLPKDQKKLDHLHKKQMEDTIKHLRDQGYKVTEEYSDTGQLSKVSGEYLPRKTWWDWLQLLIIPLVLAGVTFGLGLEQSKINDANNASQHMSDQTATAQQRITDQQIATDQQQEATLKSYLDDMADLLFNHKLRNSKPEDEVSQVAKERTLTTLRRLDANRNKIVLQFLQDAHLIGMKNAVIDLRGADMSTLDLRGVNLSNVDLRGTNFQATNFRFANLSNASLNCNNFDGNKVCADLSLSDLTGTNLSGADLREANLSYSLLSCGQTGFRIVCVNLSGAKLEGVNLNRAYLRGVTGITNGQLIKEAKSLDGTIMPDGTTHP